MLLKICSATYGLKDRVKARPCNKFIGRGSPKSSTQFYARTLPKHIVNCGVYTSEDIVFISVEGHRTNRISFDQDEVLKAIEAKARIVTDNKENRNRAYNVGERELAAFLVAHHYAPKDYPQGCVWEWKNPAPCSCGKGYASSYDNLCKYCRKAKVPSDILKRHGLLRADGLSIYNMHKINPNY